MTLETIARAWKDPDYRARLSPDEQARLPESPAGQPLAELDELELGSAVGGWPPETAPILCCPTMNAVCTARKLCD